MITDNHRPNRAKSIDGGFKIVLSSPVNNGTHKTAVLSINSTGYGNFKGFLFKSYDLMNGGGLGDFSSLPPYTAILDSCPGKAAVTHYSREAYFNRDKPLKFTVTWPSDKELGFQAFLVESTHTWYELRSSTNGDFLPDDITLPSREGPFTVRLNESKWVVGPLVFYAPILLLVLGAMLSHNTNGPGKFGGIMHRKIFSKELQLPAWYHSESIKSPGFWVRLLTMDVAESAIAMTWGEILACFLLFVAEIASLIVWIVMLSKEQKKYFHYKDYVHPYDAVAARAFGRLLQYNLSLTLFLPTRHSLWPSLIGISFERLVKYHRIVSRVTFVVMILHLILMLAQYGFLQMFSVTDTLWGFGNLFGILAGIGMILMVLFALEPVRRSAYDLFMAVHLLAFPVLVLAILHATDTVVHLIPPLALFIFDFLLRMYQWMINVKIKDAKVFNDEVVNLKIVCPSIAEKLWNKGSRAIGSFVCIASSDVSANPSALHPFSVSGFLHETSKDQEMSQMADGMLNTMDLDSKPIGIQLHIKSMGPRTWSQRLLEAARDQGSDIRVRLEGPYGHMSLKLSEFQHVLMIAGGIGITPMMPLLEMALSPERRRAELPAMKSLSLIWIVQSSLQLLWFKELLEYAFMQAQIPSTDFKLQIQLFVTQSSQQCIKAPFTAGRPQIADLIRDAAQESMGDKAALLCGPSGLTREASAHASENGFSVHVETFRL